VSVGRSLPRASSALLTAAVAVLVWAPAAGGVQPYETYEGVVARDEPVAQFRFGDAAGSETIADSAGGYTAVNHGIVLGGEGPFPGSESGSFGGEAYASLPGDPLKEADAFTAEAWVDWGGGSAYGRPVFELGSSAEDFMYLTPSSTGSKHVLLFEIHTPSGSASVKATKAIAASAWKYLAVTEASEGSTYTLTLYVNGEAAGETKDVTLTPASLGVNVPDDFLGRSVSGESFFNGSLSNVALYGKALTATQIEEHFNDAEFPVNTSPPTISGTAREGSVMTATEGSWTGKATIKYAYQWQRCNGLGECAEISSGTKASYTAVAADVGDTLRVAVEATNGSGTRTATSAPTATVEGKPASTAAPALSGEAKVGQLLTVSEGGWRAFPAPSFAYQWEACKSTKCTAIEHATSASYRVAGSELGKTLRAVVTAKNSLGEASATSAASAKVLAGQPVSVEAPAVSGIAREGQELAATSGVWAGSEPIEYTDYRWLRCTGGECHAIEGASGAKDTKYKLTSSDVGHTIEVSVTAKNSVGEADATSAQTPSVGAVPPLNTTPPAIAGEARDGQVLTASTGSWSGSAPLLYTYQWQSCDPQGEECEDIEDASGAQYTLDGGDLEATVRVLVTATNTAGSAQAVSTASAQVEPGAPSELEGPSIAGSPREGETLVADAGSWGGSETQVGYEWERCSASGEECTEVPGQSGPEYVLGPEDVGSALRVRVGVSNQLGSITDVSQPTEVVEAAALLQNTLAPAVSGTPQSGATLTASAGSWLGTSTLGYAYQWQSCDGEGGDCEDVEGATSSTYELDEGDVGHTIRVAVTASDEGGMAAELSPATEPIAAPNAPVVEQAPLASGTTLVGDTLHASAGAFSGEAPLAYSYQWERCDEGGEACTPIAGATGSTYTLAAADARESVRAQVRATDPEGAGTSVATAALAVSPEALLDRSRPYAAGEYHEGQTLSVQPGIWTGAGPIASTEQWQRCNASGAECADIRGAGAATYALQEADVGHTVTVVETASIGLEGASAGSQPTPVIGGEPTPPIEVIEPTIEGPPTAGQTLSADPGTWAGSQPVDYAYRWQRCDEAGEECADIEGATGSSYTLAGGDVGSTVRVSVTATNLAGSVEASSYQSEVIGSAAPPSNTAAPEVSGVAKEGRELAASDGAWSGSRPLTYTRRWERCEAAGEGCEEIAGATNTTYTPTSADVGHTLRLYVTASNHLGSATARSAPSAAVVSAQEASVSEAVNAVEQSDPSLLAPASAAQVEEETVKPATEDTGEELSSSSAPTGSTISKQTAGELALETPTGELALEPVEVAPGASTLPAVVNGTAAVYAETEQATDTIVRPDALGATTLTQLRSSAAPTSFSWELNLTEHQQLEQLSDGAVAVVELPPEDELEASLEEAMETPEGPGETTGTSSEETPPSGQEPEEGEEPSLIEALPASPQMTTPPFEPRASEMQPQDTQATYETDSGELAEAEREAQGTTLIVIDRPRAMDEAGNEVPASLGVEGDTVTLTLLPGAHAAYPITAAMHVASRGGKHAGPPAPEYGLSDGHYQQFEESEEKGEVVHKFDQRLTRGGGKAAPLRVRSARLVLWWKTSPESPELKKWLRAVKAAGLKPLITLGSCRQGRLPNETCTSSDEPNPTDATTDVERYREAFKKLFVGLKTLHHNEPSVYPSVTSWGAWNEPDRKGEPLAELSHGPEVAAYFWQAARAVVYNSGCHDCRVVAGEFEDYTARKPYAEKYIHTILYNKRYWQRDKPKTWGIHDYGDVVRAYLHQGNPIAEAFLTKPPWGRLGLGEPHEWITEAGVHLDSEGTLQTGCYRQSNGFTKPLSALCKHQRVDAEDFLQLHDVTGKKGLHFERLYYYEYRASAAGPEHSFDSALLEPESVKEPEDWRPAYCVLAFHNHHCPPTTITKSVVAATLTPTSATVQLTVKPYEERASYRVEYGPSSEYGATTAATPALNEEGEQSETVAIGGLQPCTTYHYQSEAEGEANEGEPSLGGEETFETSGCPPTVVTGYAEVTSYEGNGEWRLTGEIDPNGTATNYYFEYGEKGTYTHASPVREAGSGTSPVEVSAEVEGEGIGLDTTPITPHPDSLFCEFFSFRLVGSNAGGVVDGENAEAQRCI